MPAKIKCNHNTVLKKLLVAQLITLSALTHGVDAKAAGCESYPYSDGINVEAVQGGVKIISTASSSVSFDDIDSVKDAQEESQLEAKAAIARFLNEGIKSDQMITRAVNETKSMSGAGKENVRNESIERVKQLRSSSQALLRGVVPLGDCYTKGKIVRFSVGLKPETIDAAGKAAGAMQGSTSSSNSPGAVNPTLEPIDGVDGYSNDDRLKKF